MIGLIGHVTRLVVARASPVLSSSNLLFPIRSGLFNAEGHRDNRIGVRER